MSTSLYRLPNGDWIELAKIIAITFPNNGLDKKIKIVIDGTTEALTIYISDNKSGWYRDARDLIDNLACRSNEAKKAGGGEYADLIV